MYCIERARIHWSCALPRKDVVSILTSDDEGRNLSRATQITADPFRAIPTHGNVTGSVGVMAITSNERGPVAIGALATRGCRVPRTKNAVNGNAATTGSRAFEQTEIRIPFPENRALSMIVCAETWIRRRRRTTFAVAFTSVSVIFTVNTRYFFLALLVNANTVVAPIAQKLAVLVNRTTV
jgi:hypothetical protein